MSNMLAGQKGKKRVIKTFLCRRI